MQRKILVCTPIDHLPGVHELVQTKGQVVYQPYGGKTFYRKVLLEEKCDTIVCNPNLQTFIIDKDLLQATKVKTILSCSTGLNHIDSEYCDHVGIQVLSLTKDQAFLQQLPSTAELAFTLMGALLRQIIPGHEDVSVYGNWDYTQYVGRQLRGLTVGIVGYGRLGKMMSDFCLAFGMHVLVYDPKNPIQPDFSTDGTLRPVDKLNELFEECDVISLHVHVAPDTIEMINQDLFGYIKKDLYIVNTSRGEIVNEEDLVMGIEEGLIKGYATDVIQDEFHGTIDSSPIVMLSRRNNNIIITPHIGGMTHEGQLLAYKYAINKL